MSTQGAPTPWWQLPEYQGSRENLEQSAPEGYEYDPVKMEYGRTPASAGSRQSQYLESALGGLGMGGGSGSGSGSLGAFGIGGSGSGSSGTGTGPVSSGAGSIAPMQMPDTTGAMNASFASAKDQIGHQARASLASLNDELGAQGMLGSGAQVQGTRDIIQSGAGELGQVRRDQAVTKSNTAQDTAKTNYAGALTQRGQDINAQEANARLAFEQRQAAAQQQLQLLTLALSGLKSGSSY